MNTVIETANLFGVTELTVRKWIKDGLKIEWAKKIGQKPHILIDPSEVEAYHMNKAVKKGE